MSRKDEITKLIFFGKDEAKTKEKYSQYFSEKIEKYSQFSFRKKTSELKIFCGIKCKKHRYQIFEYKFCFVCIVFFSQIGRTIYQIVGNIKRIYRVYFE